MVKRQLADLLEIFFLAVILVGVFEIKYYNRFYPNIIIGSESVAGKSYEEVLEKFKQAQKKIEADGFTLVFFRNGNSRTVSVPLASRGLTSDTVAEYINLGDAEAAVKTAFALGREGPLWKRIWNQAALMAGKKKFTFSNFINEDAVRSLLDRELVNFYAKPAPASFAATDKEIVIEPEKIGEQIDNDGNRVIRLLSKALATLETDALFFSSKLARPRVTAVNLEKFLPLVKEIAKATRLEFVYGDYLWKVSGNKLIGWLTLNENGELAVEKEKLKDFLKQKVDPVVYNPPQNSRFEIRNNKLAEIFQGQSGNSVAVELLEQELNQKIKSKPRVIRLPITIVKQPPKITKETIEKYDIKELVAEVKTSFKGSSEGRKQNIKTGISKLNGLLIAPGEEFSAVEAIGFTREEDGFLKEFVIKGDRSVKEAGGGLCQIATTLFRLAIGAGLPITARTNHLYVVSYYGPGLDATIYGPQKDLKFVNDTGHYLLLQAKVAGDEVLMEFYGQKDGREVAISEPVISNRIPPPKPKYVISQELKKGEEKCTEQARFGMTAEVNYKVDYLNGEINSQTFKSVYQPWQKVCLVGT